MLLSIVIPHYNLPKEMLKRCIESITAQGMQEGDYEVIIIDDGSKEPPLWIEDEYKTCNIRLINNAHGGPGAARNKGIEAAQGKYIQFIDSDDYLITNGQMLQCLAMLQEEKPQILRFGYIVKTDDAPLKPKTGKITFSNTISGAMHMRDKNLSGSPCTYFFQKSLAIENEIEFSTDIFHEDEEFNTKLHYHAQTLIESNARFYCYRIREGSTTANRSKEFEARRIDDFFTIIEKIFQFKIKNTGTANVAQTAGIGHKLHTLCVDAILNMMFDNREANEIYGRCMSQLKPLGLYPLPKANYSLKYRIFRRLANSKGGMNTLRLIIPRKKPLKR